MINHTPPVKTREQQSNKLSQIFSISLSKNSAFTLIELAIVIVIIGLIVGGVLGGQSLIRSSERQAFVKQIKNYETAVNAFKLEYDKPPGDLDDASDYWATASDGDGNGKIDGTGIETVEAWEQLTFSEIINESFFNAGTTNAISSGTSPVSELGSAYLNIVHGNRGGAGTPIVFKRGGLNKHYMSVTPIAFDSNWAENSYAVLHAFTAAFMTSEGDGIKVRDAVAVDRKIDDGNADAGLVYAWVCTDLGIGTNIVSATSDWTYDLTSTDGCIMWIQMGI